MKRKVRTGLFSALLALAMLVSLMPAAFAASWSSYGTLKLYADLDDEYYLIYDGDFDDEELYDDVWYEDGYFIIENEDDGPTVRSDYADRDVEKDELYFSDKTHYDIDDVYFDTGDYDYDETYYDYTIYGYNEDGGKIGYMTIRLYVDSSSSVSSSYDGDIYAETDKYGVLEMSEISDELYDYGYGDDNLSGIPSYVMFKNWTNGAMYDGSSSTSKTSTSDYYFFDEDDVYYTYEYYLDGAWFATGDSDEESVISFRVYDTKGNYVAGTIIVNGDGSSSAGDIKYSAEYNTKVYFSGADFENLLSSSQTLSYVTFTLPSSSKGTLYWGSDKLTAKDKPDSDDLDEVSFVPKSGVSGNVSISFKLYYYPSSSSSTTRSLTGTVVISIDSSAAITYTGEVGEPVYFDADDFDDVCYDATGKDLDYVKFTLPSSSKGTLYAEYTSKTSTAAKSADKFYVDADKDEYALDDVVFVPKTGGTVALSYTGYNTRGTSFTGTVKIAASAGSLSAINYSVTGGSSGVTFQASDFTSALKAKTSQSLSYVTFTLPQSTEGVLYYNGSAKVSAGAQYKPSGTSNTLDLVSFVPASGVSGDVTIPYTATDSSGSFYTGTVVVQTFVSQDVVLTYSTTGPAARFSNGDFVDACAKKLNTTLNYVKFSLPNSSQGTLYYGYGSTQQTRVTSSAQYLAGTHLDYIYFLPKEGFSGTVTLAYVGYDTAGTSYIGGIQVTVTPPTQSAVFTDADASWVAPAADFLNTYEVYSGIVSGSTLGVGTQTTRGEVMQMIYNAFKLQNQVASVTSNFSDVPGTHPNYVAINAGYMLGVAQGDGTGNFRPDDPITRQDACTLLYRAFQKLGLNMSTGSAEDLAAFPDKADVSSYAVDAVAGMVKSGIIEGNESGVNPKGNLTRGEMSVIVYRAMTL